MAFGGVRHRTASWFLKLASDKADWRKLCRPRGRGIACYFGFESYIAHAAEVSIDKDNLVRVNRVVTAVDCGTAVNLDGVKAMAEGAENFALTAALTGEITVKDGAVEQGNFDDYPGAWHRPGTDIEVYIVASTKRYRIVRPFQYPERYSAHTPFRGIL